MLTLPEKIVFALVLAGAIAYFAYRTILLFRILMLGKPDPDNRLQNIGANVVSTALDVFLQRKVLRKPITGLLHLLIVWGFFVFAVNTINHFAGAFLPGFHLFGETAPARYYSVAADLFALLIIIGVLGLAFRRYALRPESLTRPSVESAIVFASIGGAMAAYLWSNACEIAIEPDLVHGPRHHFAAFFLASGLDNLGEGALRAMAHVAWWTDALLHLVLVGLLVIPTKHMHLVAGPFNLVFKRQRPRGQIGNIDLEDETAESFGVARIDEFTWKQNLDLYACIECGRCQDYCPTYNSDKPLNPKSLISDLKHHLLRYGPGLVKSRNNQADAAVADDSNPPLAGGTVDKDAIWACTTCGACIEHCPMGIEHIDKLVDLRRYLALMEADFPEAAGSAFRNFETSGNPWGLAPNDRTAWTDGLNVPVLADKKEADILYWVGCSGAYDDRSRRISRAMVEILDATGADFAILGDEEKCHCESARRLGNEYLYQMALHEIEEILKQYQFKRILVTCPHCFNTFKNEYPAFGVEYPVVHHTQFIENLLESGALDIERAETTAKPIVYHDSCYLGRYNGIYDPPRDVLRSAGCNLVEAERHRERGLCCGAGGGRMWLEEDIGEQINVLRVRDLLATGAGEIAAACPFCITMLTDALKAEDRDDIEAKDIAEIIAGRLKK